MIRNIWLAIGGVALVLLFWCTGLINSPMMGFSILAIAGAIALLQVVDPGKLNTASKIFLVWVVIAVAWPLAWKYFGKTAPLVVQSSEMREVYEDLRGSEKIRPPALRSMEAYRSAIDRADEELGRSSAKALDALTDQLITGNISRDYYNQRVAQIQNQIRATKTWRRDAGNLLTEDYPSIPNPSGLTVLESIPARHIILFALALGLIIYLIGVWRKIPGVARAGWIIPVVIILWLLADRIILNGGAAQAMGQFQQPSQPTTGSTRQIQKVQIYPDKDIAIVAPHGATDVWIEPQGELTYTFPSGKTVTVPANDHLKFALPSREFKLRGNPGIATITWSF